ncbi:MAG: TetR/AcrR family transcriptional regulator [Gemmatimonadaceae bacterium]
MVKKRKKDRTTEQRILDAAHAVFIRRGTAGARMQEIADEAGVNKALLHYYFRNKDRLSLAVFQRVAAAVFGRVAQVLTSDAELEDKVRGIIAIYIDQFVKTPYAPAYVISEVNLHPERAGQFLEMISKTSGASPIDLVAMLQRQIDARVRAGTIRPIDADQFFTNLVSLCVFPFAAKPLLSAVLRLDEGGFQDYIDRRKTALPQFYLDALRP